MTKKSLKSHFEAQIFRPKRSVKYIITILLEFSFVHTMTVKLWWHLHSVDENPKLYKVEPV